MKNEVLRAGRTATAARRALWLVLFLGLSLAALAGAADAPAAARAVRSAARQAALPTPEAFFGQAQALLQKKDLERYLDLVAPAARDLERRRLDNFFHDFEMDSVRLRLAGKRTDAGGATHLYCQAYFENATAVIMETWQLGLAVQNGRWEIAANDIMGNASRLFKVRIPGGPSERVRTLELSHRDIRLSFTDAVVFHDNLPGIETAFVILGKGTVRFSPSDPVEQHEMEIIYGKPFLEDGVNQLYVRCSDVFASSHIKIGREDGLPAATEEETARAAALFSRNYPRSFTIESSLDHEFLSILPQGDEAVFEFKARRAGELTYVYYPFSEEEVNLYDRTRDRIVSLYSPGEEGSLKEKRFFVSFADKFDVDRYQLDLSYAPADSYLSGKARISVVARAPGLDTVKLRFSPDLEILRVFDQEKRELFYTRDRLRKLLYIYLIAPPAPQTTTLIEVYYRGRMHPPPPTTDVIGQSMPPTKLIFRPRFDTYFFSQSGLWYPAPPEEDYFQARLKLVVPPDYKCVSNGDLVEKGRWNEMGDVVEIEKAGSAVYTFETRFPVKYMSFIVGKFDRPKEAADPVPIRAFASTEVMANDPNLVDKARGILDFYIRSFGPYPYEKLGIVSRLYPTAGGHSPASFVVLNEIPWFGDNPYPAASGSPVNLSDWDDYFLAHEIAHQWWGQGVSFLTYKDQWLSEGLAQFAAASYLREKYGERAYASVLAKFAKWTEKKSVKGPIMLGSRLSFLDFEAYQAVVYDKAALVLFMLEDLLGPDVFLSGLREFFARHKYSAARTESFIAAMEGASGRDLGDFFQGWLRSWELPAVQTSWAEETGRSGARLRLRVTQTRGRFVFPLWVEWTSRGQVHRERLVIDKPSQEIVFDVAGKVDRVVFNPLRAVPGKFS
ncbi:MAG TPA: M1 family aminopeptidase [Terriglobales bacterium]|nr:M1 family aminopeptidase [Terriglobales bacterium]